jgi:serine/threonine protein kinase
MRNLFMPDPTGWPRTVPGASEESRSLASLLVSERELALPPWPLEGAAALLEPIAEALAVLHSKGVCHLGVTPSAIVFSSVVRSSAGVGLTASPECLPRSHSAPEQFSEAYGLAGPWTDVFALALVFVELVTGRRHTEAAAPAQLGAIAIESFRRVRRSTLPAEAQDLVESVIVRALSVYPAERFQTGESFWRALSALAWDPGGLAWHVGRNTLMARRSR